MDSYSHERAWYSQLSYLAMFGFLVTLPFLKAWGSRPLLVLVVTMVAIWLQFDKRTSVLGLGKPLELYFYWTWGVWAIVTGFFVYKGAFEFFDGVKMLVRSMVLIWAAFALFARQKNVSYYLLALITIALIHAAAGALGFHVVKDVDILNPEIVRDALDDSFRLEGLTGNANAMGSVMLAGLWASILLWREKCRNSIVLKRVILIAAMVLFTYFIIRTASRKSLMVACVLVAGWLMWMIPGRLSLKAVLVSLFMGIVLSILGVIVFGYVLPDTIMAHRFQEWFDAGGGNAAEGLKSNIRYWLYVDGFNMFLAHPIAGVGLGQFSVHHFSRLYSHSDYIEPLACTGLIGFVLYHGFAFIVVKRIIRLLKFNLPPDVGYTLKGLLLFMLCNHYLIGLGAPHWNAMNANIAIVFIGTYSWRIEQAMVKHRYFRTF